MAHFGVVHVCMCACMGVCMCMRTHPHIHAICTYTLQKAVSPVPLLQDFYRDEILLLIDDKPEKHFKRLLIMLRNNVLNVKIRRTPRWHPRPMGAASMVTDDEEMLALEDVLLLWNRKTLGELMMSFYLLIFQVHKNFHIRF